MVFKKIIGILLFLLGVVIVFTPFTPGSILLLIGFDMMIGDAWPWWVRTKQKIKTFLKRKI